MPYAYFPLTGLIDLYQPNKPQSGGFSIISWVFCFILNSLRFTFIFSCEYYFQCTGCKRKFLNDSVLFEKGYCISLGGSFGLG